MQQILPIYVLKYCILSVIIPKSSLCDAHSDKFRPSFPIISRGGSSFPNDHYATDNFHAQFQEEDRYPSRRPTATPKSLRRSISRSSTKDQSRNFMTDWDIRAMRQVSSYDPFSATTMDAYDDYDSSSEEIMENDNNVKNYHRTMEDNFDTLRQNYGDDNNANDNSPVVYKYYGRSRARGNASNPVHFILLGPNVDHWKDIGQLLASRGFNVMACERLEKESNKNRSKDAPNLVMDILQVMKWKKVVLVGCDKESLLAMETAMMLSGDQVAGLVLCGDLTEADSQSSASGFDVLDSFLKQTLQCPFVIVWDGDAPSLIHGSSARESVESNTSDRCLILGGGSAPHRTKPEQFTWILTRFVEEKIELVTQQQQQQQQQQRRPRIVRHHESVSKSMRLLQALNVPFGINSLVSPEGRLLLGRAAAAALFYIAMMKVVVVQYGILRGGLITIQSRFDSVATFRAKVFQAIGAFFLNYGYIPRLFKIGNEDSKRNVDSETVESTTESQEETKKDKKRRRKRNKKEANRMEDETVEPPTDEDDTAIQSPAEIQGPTKKPFFFLDPIIA
ncbi:unnamed protein product [Cylindrotheca closterium]|uniref:Uncharacterized protein n=1 Tax=Cylindrotheca closterium TaxID=2856 RepID=A0AAD2JPI6_9STRA|nr:unnamed protein product [Cylindrotheca closterium]